jgi:arylformamidase
MRIIDISQKIRPGMVVWPGDPQVEVNQVEKISAGDEVNLTQFSMSAHTGTHVDAPCHFIDGGKKVDDLSLEDLCGTVQVIHVPSNISEIDKGVVENAGIEPLTERVLFRTTNSTLWKNQAGEFTKEYVGITEDAAQLLVEMELKLVGVDYLSVAAGTHIRPTHETLLGSGIILLEGLDLSEVSAGRYMLYCLPLNLVGADGAPARTVLVEGV